MHHLFSSEDSLLSQLEGSTGTSSLGFFEGASLHTRLEGELDMAVDGCGAVTDLEVSEDVLEDGSTG